MALRKIFSIHKQVVFTVKLANAYAEPFFNIIIEVKVSKTNFRMLIQVKHCAGCRKMFYLFKKGVLLIVASLVLVTQTSCSIS